MCSFFYRSQSPGEIHCSHSLPASFMRERRASPTPAPPTATADNTGLDVVHYAAGVTTAGGNSRSTALHFHDDGAAPDSDVAGQQSRPGGRARTKLTPSSRYRGGDASDDGGGDGDNDSVVFGSTGEGAGRGCNSSTRDLLSAEAAAAAAAAVADLPLENVHHLSQGRAPERRKGVDRTRQGVEQELLFDPVLNCYYDNASDKYYGLP